MAEQTTQTQPTSSEKPKPDALDKALADLKFWRDAYADLENDNKQLKTLLAKKSDTEKQDEELRRELEDTRGDIVAAKSLLQELADHTAGRDGNYAKSRIFCGICENSYSCVIKKVYAFIDPPKKEQDAA